MGLAQSNSLVHFFNGNGKLDDGNRDFYVIRVNFTGCPPTVAAD
jgi:hypothetical protein